MAGRLYFHLFSGVWRDRGSYFCSEYIDEHYDDGRRMKVFPDLYHRAPEAILSLENMIFTDTHDFSQIIGYFRWPYHVFIGIIRYRLGRFS